MKKKILAIGLALMLSLSVFVGCGGEVEEISEDKTQLYVGIYNGGVGKDWLTALKKEYEELKANESFEEGKKGVQIVINTGKDNYQSATLMNTVDNRDEDMFILDGLGYNEWLKEENWDGDRCLLEDVTDIVTGTNNPYTEGKGYTVEQILNPTLKDYLNKNGHYYALPYYDGEHQMTYDVDLFTECGFFIKSVDAQGNITAWTEPCEKIVDKQTGDITFKDYDTKCVKWVGRDGIAGTFDDGLPDTYSQFFKLLDKISHYKRPGESKTVTPFTWSGDNWDTYLRIMLNAFVAQYEGAEVYAKNFNTALDGDGTEFNDIVDLDASFKLTKNSKGEITNATSNRTIGTFKASDLTTYSETIKWGEKTLDGGRNYDGNFNPLMSQRAGVYYAICFAYDLINYVAGTKTGKVFDTKAVSGSDTHMAAQARYVYSDYNSEPIAMLIDGNWWENEAGGSFQEMAENAGPQYGRYKRNFAYMPVPNPDDKAGNPTVLTPFSGQSAIFIKSSATQKELARDFFAFIHTKESMATMTSVSGVMRPFDYEITGEKYDAMSKYSKSLYALKQAVGNEGVIHRVPLCSALETRQAFIQDGMFFMSDKNNGYNCPFHSFYENKSNSTNAELYFAYCRYNYNNKD